MEWPVIVQGVAGSLALLLAVVALGLILHPEFDDRFLIRFGLSFLTIGLGAVGVMMWQAGEVLGSLSSAVGIALLGVMLVVIGYLLRCAAAGHPLRRRTDWFIKGLSYERQTVFAK